MCMCMCTYVCVYAYVQYACLSIWVYVWVYVFYIFCHFHCIKNVCTKKIYIYTYILYIYIYNRHDVWMWYHWGIIQAYNKVKNKNFKNGMKFWKFSVNNGETQKSYWKKRKKKKIIWFLQTTGYLSAILCFWLRIPPCSESPHSEPGALDEVDNGPNTSDEGEQPNADCSWSRERLK